MMSKLHFVNKFVCQWFFFRICRLLDDSDKQVAWGVMFPVKPLTGWEGKPYAPDAHKITIIWRIK
jgi:hypothetical protein